MPDIYLQPESIVIKENVDMKWVKRNGALETKELMGQNKKIKQDRIRQKTLLSFLA